MMMAVQGQGQSLLGRFAEAEARRRLIITAIALERFRGQHGEYPKALEQLSPELLRQPLVDFMDGQPLRYRLMGDRRFILYSVGLDCVDDGGDLRRPQQDPLTPGGPRGFGTPPEPDLVWPRPASAAELAAFHREQTRARGEQRRREEEQQAKNQWNWTAKRQAQMAKTPTRNLSVSTTEPVYRGRPLAEILGNKSTLRPNTSKLADLLTLEQIITGSEPEIITFDAPIAYDVLTKFGELALLVDPVEVDDFIGDSRAGWLEFHRATNGNCRLVWNTIYESPGPHVVQLGLEWRDSTNDDGRFFTGPPASLVVSNLCQFSLSSAYFKPELGATLRAKLPESNATYSVEITSPAGELLKTITGTTSNGFLTVHWDLVDEHGIRCTNTSFNTLLHLKLPESGRSQTLKGP
jgi:hypothetical protein